MIIKPKTIERQIKYSNKPYPSIISSARKKGWKVSLWSYSKNYKIHRVTLVHPDGWKWETEYCLNDPTVAIYNSFNWPK